MWQGGESGAACRPVSLSATLSAHALCCQPMRYGQKKNPPSKNAGRAPRCTWSGVSSYRFENCVPRLAP
jgi:hypothetical protein